MSAKSKIWGGSSGSREPNPQAVSALTGFDPGRKNRTRPQWKSLKKRRRLRTEPKAKERVYVVFCEGGDAPTVVHSSFKSAAKEAARLAHFNRGKRFHLLSSIRICAKPTGETA